MKPNQELVSDPEQELKTDQKLKNVSLSEYRDALDVLAKNGEPSIFSNKGADHAAVVMSTIFKYANCVKIYANDMNGDISNQQDYVEALKLFLDNENELKVIIDVNPFTNETCSKSISYLKRVRNKNVDFRLASDLFKEALKKVTENGETYHFAVGDGKMIRIETDNKTHEAPYVSFNSVTYAKAFENVFDLHFSECKKIDIK